jgi:hypothetical protein
MKKCIFALSIIILLCVKPTYAYASEEAVAGISTLLDNVNTDDVKASLGYMWCIERVNFRQEPNTQSYIYETLNKRTEVYIISKEKDWYKVKYNNTIGYIYSEYLTDKPLFTSNKNKWGIELMDNEIDLLAKIVYLESMGESDKGQQAVVEVVFNRMIHPEFPNTSLKDVLSQDNQFSTWDNRNNAKPTQKEYDNINYVLNGNTDILNKNTVYFGTSPHNDKLDVKIGEHYFCKY